MTGPAADWPPTLSINAWPGEPASSPIGARARSWILGQDGDEIGRSSSIALGAPKPPEPHEWQRPEVGWGVVLPWTGGPVEEQARLTDAPAPIRKLAEARAGAEGPVVLRYAAEDGFSRLRRVYLDGRRQDVAITGGETGTDLGQRPAYLLIAGSPSELSWDLQCRLNLSCFVGRLDLPADALARYVDCLLSGWAGSAAQARKPVVWATDGDDMTEVMRIAVAERLRTKFEQDDDTKLGLRYLSGPQATVGGLIGALIANRPAVVVTTSHGRTGPLDDPAAMARDLGLPVDAERALVDPATVLAAWQPDGAIWYAHACCSAGSDSFTRYTGLVEEGSLVDRVLNGVAALGARVSSLPTALLSAEKPARAFIGHVEPTFDWTLESPATRQLLSTSIVRAMYTGCYQTPSPEPIGLAWRTHFTDAGELFGESSQENRNSRRDSPERQRASAALLTAFDRQSMVILGDPTVCAAAL